MELKAIKTFTVCYQNTEEDRKATDKIIIDMCCEIASKYETMIEKFLINPTGKFKIGGFEGDAGLTGRKIIVDTCGGYARHGGGAFSGKDSSKVDRSAAYMLRHIAKNVVANGYAEKCEIQISYGIGIAKPISIYVNTFGTHIIEEDEIERKIEEKLDLTADRNNKIFRLKKTNIFKDNKLWTFR